MCVCVCVLQLMLDLGDYEGVQVKWMNEKDAGRFGVREHPSLLLKVKGASNTKLLAG